MEPVLQKFKFKVNTVCCMCTGYDASITKCIISYISQHHKVEKSPFRGGWGVFKNFHFYSEQNKGEAVLQFHSKLVVKRVVAQCVRAFA